MRLPIFLLALGVLPALAANRALLIGVGDYQPPISKLPGIDRDMALAREFAGLIGFRPGEIKELFNQQATLGNIKQHFHTWLAEAGPNDKVFVYFSGHGAYVPDANGDERDRQDELLVTYDTTVANRQLVNYLLDDEVHAMVAELRSKHVLLIFDSCHSGSAAKSLGVEEKRALFPGAPRKSAGLRTTARPRYVLLSACRDDETAGASKQGSFLTTNLLTLARQRKAAGQPFGLRAVEAELAKGVVRSKPDQHPGVEGDDELQRADWFSAASGNGSGDPPVAPPAPPRPPAGEAPLTGPLAENLEGLYNQRTELMKCGMSGGQELKSGGTVTMDCTVPWAGFLYVFNLGGGDAQITQVFPNKWAQSAAVEPGPIQLPSASRRFTVRVKLPENMASQPVRLYAFLLPTELKELQKSLAEGFPPLTPAQSRTLAAEGPEGYAAARIEFRIVR